MSTEELDLDSILKKLSSALEAGDAASVLAMFTDDIQLHSPALIGPEYRGRNVVDSIVTAAMQVLEDIHVTDVLRAMDATTVGVVFDARVGDLESQGLLLLRTNAEYITELTLFVRPLAALRTFVAGMAELGAQPALDARNG